MARMASRPTSQLCMDQPQLVPNLTLNHRLQCTWCDASGPFLRQFTGVLLPHHEVLEGLWPHWLGWRPLRRLQCTHRQRPGPDGRGGRGGRGVPCLPGAPRRWRVWKRGSLGGATASASTRSTLGPWIQGKQLSVSHFCSCFSVFCPKSP